VAPTPYKFIADKIQNILSPIANIGNVHNYQRYFNDDETFRQLCFDQTNDRVAVWFVTRDDGYEDKLLDYTVTRRYSRMVLKGYMGSKDLDLTEIIFQQVCDDICTAFPLHTHLIDNQMLVHEPPTMRFKDERLFYNIKCHYAEISLIIREYYLVNLGLAIT
jgi:hypothetical protein